MFQLFPQVLVAEHRKHQDPMVATRTNWSHLCKATLLIGKVLGSRVLTFVRT
jgi:hypothetical protein